MKNIFLKILIIVLFIIISPLSTYANTINNNNNITPPSINARHAVILDRCSKQVLYGKKENASCKMASTTKIMTAIIVLEKSNLNDTVIISSKASQTGGSRLGLSTNDKITVENLLYGLMLKSGNDAAVALAEHVGGSIDDFAKMMNEKSKKLQLKSTHFVTPHGLDNDDHYTSAFDLAILTDYALKNETFAKIVKTKTYTIYLHNYAKNISNTNELLGNLDGVYGVKTGFTNGANRCLVTACKRGNLDIICVVLGCDTKKYRSSDSVKLINYIFNNYSIVNIKDIITNNFNDWVASHQSSFYINKGETQNLNLYLNSNDFSFTHLAVKNSDLENIHTDISFEDYFESPLPRNSIIGKIFLVINEKEYLSIDILNSNHIQKKNIFNYLQYIAFNYFSFFHNLKKKS